jgi:hypothetical protein
LSTPAIGRGSFGAPQLAFGAVVFRQLLGLGVTYQMASGGLWPGAMLLGLASVAALLALFLAPARARWAGPYI